MLFVSIKIEAFAFGVIAWFAFALKLFIGAKTVIAINPDKDARIFEYADYGIIEEF